MVFATKPKERVVLTVEQANKMRETKSNPNQREFFARKASLLTIVDTNLKK